MPYTFPRRSASSATRWVNSKRGQEGSRGQYSILPRLAGPLQRGHGGAPRPAAPDDGGRRRGEAPARAGRAPSRGTDHREGAKRTRASATTSISSVSGEQTTTSGRPLRPGASRRPRRSAAVTRGGRTLLKGAWGRRGAGGGLGPLVRPRAVHQRFRSALHPRRLRAAQAAASDPADGA